MIFFFINLFKIKRIKIFSNLNIEYFLNPEIILKIKQFLEMNLKNAVLEVGV